MKHLWTPLLLILLVLLLLALLVGLGVALRGKGVRMALLHRVRAIIHRGDVVRYGNFTNVIFLHHSVGRNLIHQGGVRERLTEAGFHFWDHDYNWEGLTRPDGTLAGYSYGIPGDNTDPDGLARLFSQPVFPWPINAFSGLLQHEVIIIKSCFPNSNIQSDEQFREMQGYYLKMRERMGRFPNRLFIIVTTPPLNPAETTPEAAARARFFPAGCSRTNFWRVIPMWPSLTFSACWRRMIRRPLTSTCCGESIGKEQIPTPTDSLTRPSGRYLPNSSYG